MEPGTADQFSENKRKNTKIKENNDIKKDNRSEQK